MISCQHCGEAADETRTFCPSCRRRLRPAHSVAATGTAAAPAGRATPVPAAVAPDAAPAPATAPASEPAWTFPGATAPRPVAQTPVPLLSRCIVAALVAVAAADVWLIVAELHRASVASGLINNPASFDLGGASSADHRVHAASIAYFLVVALAGLLFISWLYQVVDNVAKRRPQDLRHGKGWAIGGWFVPILNWFRPKQMVDDAWRGTRPDPAGLPTVPAFVHVWWAFFVLSGLLTGVGARLPTDTLHNVLVHDRVGAVGHAVNLVAAVFAALVVVRVTQRAADDRWQTISTAPATAYDVR